MKSGVTAWMKQMELPIFSSEEDSDMKTTRRLMSYERKIGCLLKAKADRRKSREKYYGKTAEKVERQE